MKKIGILLVGLNLSLIGFSQTSQQQLEKQINDPKRKENAGKADVIITKKKNVFDSTTFKNNTVEAPKASARKNHCTVKTTTSKKRT